MTLDYLFAEEEQRKMFEIAERARADAQEKGYSPKKCCFYLNKLDPDYHITQRFIIQFERCQKRAVGECELVTISELADYLRISRSTISRPLKSKMNPIDYKDMIRLFRRVGGTKGGKNGNKTANFKGSKNS